MTEHYQTQDIRTPSSTTACCSCGWRHKETRRQNAFARVAKLNAAFRKHVAEAVAKDTP